HATGAAVEVRVDRGQPAMAGLEALVARAGDTALTAFYRERSFAPVWSKGAGVFAPTRARALQEAVRASADHALPMRRFRPDDLAAALDRPWDAEAELLFTTVYLDYARAVNSGALEPRKLDRMIRVRPVRPEPAVLLGNLVRAVDVGAHLAGLMPKDPAYGTLVARLAELRAAAGRPDAWGPRLSKGATLREGDRGSRVAMLRARLEAMGDLPAAPAVPGGEAALVATAGEVVAPAVAAERFDAGLAEAVRRFQARHGLNEDGVVGPATREALNTGPAERARQVAVNLERIRWNHTRLVGDRIQVNLPDFRVDVIEDGAVAFTSRTVIGKYRHQTVEFSDTMEHMVVNPTWHVPMSIARNEILPKLRENPYYLEERNMSLVGAEDPALIDWTTVNAADFPGRIRQAPGPGNALGRVKFMFPNDYAIYLHDTPQRGLFRRDNRAYSHGCVRVEKPLELAYALLSGQVDDPERSFRRWRNTGREIYVVLDQPRPVHLIYRTAFDTAEGLPAYRRDVYRRDALVAEALEKAGAELPET
ncbi:MAG: L,D-transpeptidase family protein, partial [Pseudomonadota bacterium]